MKKPTEKELPIVISKPALRETIEDWLGVNLYDFRENHFELLVGGLYEKIRKRAESDVKA